jgi:predicted MFS family arabinose efflux permease
VSRFNRFRKKPENMLLLMAVGVPLSFDVWRTLLNNFAIERVAFTGDLIGILQSLREVPGFLVFTAIFVLLLIREQRFAVLALATMGLGTALTGFFPSVYGLYFTTIIMSIGFHYFEAVQTSLSLQWLPKERAPVVMGRLISVGAFGGLVTFGFIYLAYDTLKLDFTWLYLIGGGATMMVAFAAYSLFPRFESHTAQRKTIVLRKRYWLYYALTFMAGARRQIFVVFAGFMMVERFGFAVHDMALLFLANGVMSMLLAPRIGRLIAYWGERKSLTVEYIGLIAVFLGYAFVGSAEMAIFLFILDHVFFAMAIAIKTYFQKIADPADIASTASVGFSINHVAAVVIPAVFGLIWMVAPSMVFFLGASMAAVSLMLSRLIPPNPEPGAEVYWPGRLQGAPAGE